MVIRALHVMFFLSIIGLLFFDPTAAFADDASASAPDGQITLRGRVLLADGTPAEDATVASLDVWDHGDTIATTDAEGWFEMTDVFGFDCNLHARSADGAQQTTLRISAFETRTRFAEPVEITLQPASEQSVLVTFQDQPVEAASVIAVAHTASFRALGMTGADGRVVLRFPAGERIRQISGWHGSLGIDGVHFEEGTTIPEAVELELRPTAPHTIRFVDLNGNPLPDVPFASHLAFDGGSWLQSWRHCSEFEQARLRTGPDGSVTIPWFPAEFYHVGIEVLGNEWKFHEAEQAEMTGGDTVVHVQPQHLIEGRLEMPAGHDATGLLIQGVSFGPGSTGHVPRTRARADGTFSLPVCSNHAYFLSVIDSEWASDEWSGVILPTEDSEPIDVVIPIYRATPVEIRVTRGRDELPVSNAFVEFHREEDAEWRDASGEGRGGVNGVQGWLRTDAQGIAHAALGRGIYQIRLADGDWPENQRLEITTSSPQLVVFHRPWEEEHTVTGQLLQDGQPFAPTPSTKLLTWGINPDGYKTPVAIEQDVASDGTFAASFDAEEIGVFAYDSEHNLSGYFVFGPNVDSADIELYESGTYSGRLIDSNGEPLTGYEITIQPETTRQIRVPSGSGFSFDLVRGPDLDVVPSATTDEEGNFQLEGVPTHAPVSFRLIALTEPSGYISRYEHILLAPGEHRENGVVTFHFHDETLLTPRATDALKPLAERLQLLLSLVDASGMHLLVVLRGDDSPHMQSLTQTCTDYDEFPEVLKYLPMFVNPEIQQRDADALAQQGWPLPEPGELVLVALNSSGVMLGAERFPAHNETVATGSLQPAAEFIAQHAPPTRNAHQAFAEAKALAGETDRRVWLVSSGPRCNPCFLLAEWMQQQHELLEKDYVIVKLGICDEYADEVLRPYGPVPSIPWFVILDADGNELITSDGPLGNVGFPTGIEDKRYFREMLDRTAQRLTDEEKSQLVDSVQEE